VQWNGADYRLDIDMPGKPSRIFVEADVNLPQQKLSDRRACDTVCRYIGSSSLDRLATFKSQRKEFSQWK
jgi:hypothetical protein